MTMEPPAMAVLMLVAMVLPMSLLALFMLKVAPRLSRVTARMIASNPNFLAFIAFLLSLLISKPRLIADVIPRARAAVINEAQIHLLPGDCGGGERRTPGLVSAVPCQGLRAAVVLDADEELLPVCGHPGRCSKGGPCGKSGKFVCNRSGHRSRRRG